MKIELRNKLLNIKEEKDKWLFFIIYMLTKQLHCDCDRWLPTLFKFNRIINFSANNCIKIILEGNFIEKPSINFHLALILQDQK